MTSGKKKLIAQLNHTKKNLMDMGHPKNENIKVKYLKAWSCKLKEKHPFAIVWMLNETKQYWGK